MSITNVVRHFAYRTHQVYENYMSVVKGFKLTLDSPNQISYMSMYISLHITFRRLIQLKLYECSDAPYNNFMGHVQMLLVALHTVLCTELERLFAIQVYRSPESSI